jgi:hypothetical protein
MSSNLMEKLAISKAIMDKHNDMGRGQVPSQSYNTSSPELDNFEPPSAKYNIPQELMSESKPINTLPQVATKDRILSSKLPDEIKKLMIENPIIPVSPMSPSSSVLSDELIEKASRLMGTNKGTQTKKSINTQNITESTVDNNSLRKMIKEVLQEVISENGLALESTSKTNETVVIKVGQHIFEGKISRIKKTK